MKFNFPQPKFEKATKFFLVALSSLTALTQGLGWLGIIGQVFATNLSNAIVLTFLALIALVETFAGGKSKSFKIESPMEAFSLVVALFAIILAGMFVLGLNLPPQLQGVVGALYIGLAVVVIAGARR